MAENTIPTETVTVTVTEKENSETAFEKEENLTSSTVMESAKHSPLQLIILSLTIFSFFLSLPVLSSIIWLLYMRRCDCEDLLQLPKLQMGIVVGLIILFFASNLVVYFRSRFPMLGTVIVMVPLMAMLIVGLALVGAYGIQSREIPGSPTWLRMKLISNANWNNIKSCIYDTRTCEDLITRSSMVKVYDFTNNKLTPIELGCCIPPSSCEMKYVNATYWRKEEEIVDGSKDQYNIDCDLWRNDETGLCYNCHACKEGFIRTIRGKWSKLGTFLVVMTILLIVAHLSLFVATMCENHAKKGL